MSSTAASGAGVDSECLIDDKSSGLCSLESRRASNIVSTSVKRSDQLLYLIHFIHKVIVFYVEKADERSDSTVSEHGATRWGQGVLRVNSSIEILHHAPPDHSVLAPRDGLDLADGVGAVPLVLPLLEVDNVRRLQFFRVLPPLWLLDQFGNKHFEPVLVCCGFFLTVR